MRFAAEAADRPRRRQVLRGGRRFVGADHAITSNLMGGSTALAPTAFRFPRELCAFARLGRTGRVARAVRQLPERV